MASRIYAFSARLFQVRCGVLSSFSTFVHNFAQIFRKTPLDAVSQCIYLAHQIEPEAKQFSGAVRGRKNLTVFVALDGTGKF